MAYFPRLASLGAMHFNHCLWIEMPLYITLGFLFAVVIEGVLRMVESVAIEQMKIDTPFCN